MCVCVSFYYDVQAEQNTHPTYNKKQTKDNDLNDELLLLTTSIHKNMYQN